MVNSEEARVALARRTPCPCLKKPKAAGGQKIVCKKCNGSGFVMKPLSRSYMWALKAAASAASGREWGRYFNLDDVKAYLRQNPGFNSKRAVAQLKLDSQCLREVVDFLKDPSPIWSRREKRDELVRRLETLAA